MKILLLSYYFSAGLEGTAIVFINIAKLLAKNGHKVWVVTNKFEGVNYPKHENIKIVFVSSPRKIQTIRKTTISDTIRFVFSTFRVGLSIAKKEKIDLIHSNSGIAGIAGSFISSLTSKPHIITIHSVYTEEFWREWTRQPGNSSFKAFLGKISEKLIVQSKHSAIHTVSEVVKDNLEKLGEKKPINVIPNAIQINDPIIEDVNPFQFIVISRLVVYKNVQVILKALKIVKKKFPKVNLLIMGDGPYRKTLEGLVDSLELQDNVKLLGTVMDEEEKNKYLASSQALLHASYYESFGLVILEAFSQKKPVIVSDIKPFSEIVEDGKNGILVPPNDEKKWAQAIISILSKPEDTSKMGESGRQTLKEKYSLEKMNAKIMDIYHQTLE